MAVIRYFGLPGCGKTTTLAMLAYKAAKSGKYPNIYSNVELHVHGVTCVPFEVFGTYELRDCLFLIDEAMIVCGDRDHKAFSKEKLKEFMMHRHKYCDIVLFSQEADGVDKKIRSITDRMYYVKKGLFTGKWISSIYKIPYDVMFPEAGDHIGDIIMGYKRPPFLARLFAKRLYRPKYYPYFDSWESDPLPDLPSEYRPYVDPNYRKPLVRPYLNKTTILLRSLGQKIFGPMCGPSEPLRCPLATFGGFGTVLSRIKIMVLFRLSRCFHLTTQRQHLNRCCLL